MKNIKKLVFSLLFFSVLFSGCEPEELEGELGTPFNKTEGIAGTWSVENVIQHDLKAPATSANRQLRLTDRFDFSTTRITFKTTPATFTIEAPEGPVIFPASGTWSFDDPEFPTEVRLVGADQKNVTLKLGSAPRAPFPGLTLSFERMARKDQADPNSDKEAIIRYDYQLKRLAQ